MRVLFAIFVGVMILFSGGCASKNLKSDEPCFEPVDLDANGDGVVTKEEALAFYTEEFKWFDQNGDGRIALDDFVSTPEVKAIIDKNSDGIVTIEEYLDYYGNNPCVCD